MRGTLKQSGKQLYSLIATFHGHVLKLATIVIFEDDDPIIEPSFALSYGIIETVRNGGNVQAVRVWSNRAGKKL